MKASQPLEPDDRLGVTRMLYRYPAIDSVPPRPQRRHPTGHPPVERLRGAGAQRNRGGRHAPTTTSAAITIAAAREGRRSHPHRRSGAWEPARAAARTRSARRTSKGSFIVSPPNPPAATPSHAKPACARRAQNSATAPPSPRRTRPAPPDKSTASRSSAGIEPSAQSRATRRSRFGAPIEQRRLLQRTRECLGHQVKDKLGS